MPGLVEFGRVVLEKSKMCTLIMQNCTTTNTDNKYWSPDLLMWTNKREYCFTFDDAFFYICLSRNTTDLVHFFPYQSFWGIPPEECLARLAGNGIKVVTQSPVPTHTTIFVLFILSSLVCQVIWTQIHWPVIWVRHGWHSVTVGIFKAAEIKKKISKFESKDCLNFPCVMESQ